VRKDGADGWRTAGRRWVSKAMSGKVETGFPSDIARKENSSIEARFPVNELRSSRNIRAVNRRGPAIAISAEPSAAMLEIAALALQEFDAVAVGVVDEEEACQQGAFAENLLDRLGGEPELFQAGVLTFEIVD